MKPSLDLYLGQKVAAITRGEQPWEWGIKLEGGAEIRNKSRRETIAPTKIVGMRMSHLSLSVHDTTIHFTGPGATKVTLGLVPTQYAICDQVHGGEVYPQWPEQLEELGIPSHPEEGISAHPSLEWPDEEHRLLEEGDRRRAGEAQTFLAPSERDGEATE